MGKLVAVEGPDKVGKSTLLQHLGFDLRERGFSTAFFRFPPDTKGDTDLLYDIYMSVEDPHEKQHHLVQLFNRYGPDILAALREHDLVLIDRYMLSVLAATRALDLDEKLIRQNMRSALIPPDLTLIYTGEPFHTPRDETPAARDFRKAVSHIFESDIPEYPYPTVRVTNEAARGGKFQLFVEHLADQLLGHLRMPLRKPETPSRKW